ncbi:MAG: M23 family metallopeptidase [Lewinellaceae bacterium]|nr:M23 family metallopeptidase [Lewinellaceae bacterium]
MKKLLQFILACVILGLVNTPLARAQQTFGYPVNGTNVSTNCYFGDNCASPPDQHTGVDFTDDVNGTTIKAAADGKVHYMITWQGNDHGMGTTIIIQHRLSNGLTRYSLYAHLNSSAAGLSEGSLVDKGQTIGVMGASGYDCATYWCNTNCSSPVGCSNTHLHFEVKNSGILSNPSGTGTYYGYTPNAPGGYGYQDPLYYINNNSITVIPQPDLITPANAASNVPTNAILDWATVAGATNYRIQIKVGSSSGWTPENGFTSSSGTSSSIPVNTTTGATSLWSGNLSPNTTYYWTVRVANNSTNSFYCNPISFTTSAASTAATPTSVSASDGTYTDRVRINWSSSAPYKKVWRNTSSSTSGMTALTGWITASTFDDFSASPGVTYYYRVQAANSSSGSGASAYSSYNSGYRAASTAATPTSVSASDGTYTDRVRINWSSSAPYKKVWRNTSSSTSGMTALTGWITTSTFDDFSASPGVTYYYRVQAANSSSGSGASAYSSYNSGYRAASSAATPTSVSASDGTYTDRVRINWSSSAPYKKVWRNTSSSTSGMTALTGWITASTFDDFSASPGVTYYYRVQAANSSSGSGASAYSSYNSGYRAASSAATPTSVSASDGTYTDRVRINWSSSAPYKKVWRNTSSSTSGMTALTGWITTSTFDDFSASPGVTYYYRVQAANSSSGSGTSAYSSYNSGYRASGSGSSAPGNDNPCSATTLSASSSCSSTGGTTINATNTTNPAPPTGCTYYGKDVWFKVQIPSSGIVTIRTTAGTLTDAMMALYYGSCSSLQGIVCEDDNSNGNGSWMPVITVSGYSPGTWIYARIWGYNGSTGTFSVCAMNYSTVNLVGDNNADEVAPEIRREKTSFRIYPNPSPSGQEVTFEVVVGQEETGPAQIYITDITGKTIEAIDLGHLDQGVNTYRYHSGKLPPGLYLGAIHSKAFSQAVRFSILE